MILLGGIPSESPLMRVAEALDQIGAGYRMFNQRHSANCAIRMEIDAKGVGGTLTLDGETLDLADITAVYLRLMDDRLLPELEGASEHSTSRRHARALHDTLYRWMEVTPARVVNRCDPQGSNGSKPYQAQLIAGYGLRVPETLISNDPESVLAFRAKHGKVIYKSMSGVRSIVKTLEDDELRRLENIRWCPVQFQALVPGIDMRVHVIGHTVFATEIISDVIDYRYARMSGGSATLRATEISIGLADSCIALTAGLGLAFAGIDLRLAPDGTATCFEVNPSPAYSYYEANTGQQIAAALARYLSAADPQVSMVNVQ